MTVVVNPPFPTMSTEQLDHSFDLPYTRLPHPKYNGKRMPAYDMIKHQQYDIPLGCVLYPDNPAFIPELFRKMYREFNMNNPYREELMDGYTRELLIKLSRSIYSASTLSQIDRKEQEKLQQLRYRIISNPERRWTVEEMAKSVSLSVSRFHAVYKQLFGRSPMKDVIAAKVELAKSLLLMEENMTLSEVTERLGYKNQQHFIRQFKATTGLTPGDYRMNNR